MHSGDALVELHLGFRPFGRKSAKPGGASRQTLAPRYATVATACRNSAREESFTPIGAPWPGCRRVSGVWKTARRRAAIRFRSRSAKRLSRSCPVESTARNWNRHRSRILRPTARERRHHPKAGRALSRGCRGFRVADPPRRMQRIGRPERTRSPGRSPQTSGGSGRVSRAWPPGRRRNILRCGAEESSDT